jgi:SAM-dependent methyltransferase
MPYFLPEAYVERPGAPQSYDAGAEESEVVWQAEVYSTAHALAEVFGLRNILDFGCGSGFKLLEKFGDSQFLTLGIDMPPAVARLKQKYPDRCWKTSGEFVTEDHSESPDLLICADVLEHVDDPDALLELFKHIRPAWLVISTPDRKLMAKYPKWGKPMGPPSNHCHVREWEFDEFHQYLNLHFDIIRHWISNESQCTQAAILRIRQ